jgi:hypothetical protein
MSGLWSVAFHEATIKGFLLFIALRFIHGERALPLNTLRPGYGDEGIAAFLDDVCRHLCDRASKREQSSFHHHAIYQSARVDPLYFCLPEKTSDTAERTPPPANLRVLILSELSPDELTWIERTSYCIVGVQRMNSDLPNISYVLTHVIGSDEATRVFSIDSSSSDAAIYSRDQLLEEFGYPAKSSERFFVAYRISNTTHFERCRWKIDTLRMRSEEVVQPHAYIMSLETLLMCVSHS